MELSEVLAVGRTVGVWGALVWTVGKLIQWMIERSDQRIELVIEQLERIITRLEAERASLVVDRDRWRHRYLAQVDGTESDDR